MEEKKTTHSPTANAATPNAGAPSTSVTATATTPANNIAAAAAAPIATTTAAATTAPILNKTSTPPPPTPVAPLQAAPTSQPALPAQPAAPVQPSRSPVVSPALVSNAPTTVTPPAHNVRVATPVDSKSGEQEDKMLTDSMKKSSLNPNAKEFVLNPNARVFIPVSCCYFINIIIYELFMFIVPIIIVFFHSFFRLLLGLILRKLNNKVVRS